MTADGRSTQIVVFAAITALIVALCVIVLIGIDRNRSALMEAVGIPTVPPPDPSRAGARLKAGDLQHALGDPGNYPQDALNRGEQGSVSAMLAVAATGAVVGCRTVKSSGFVSLGRATCRLVHQVRFEPARDGLGQAQSSSFVLRMRWVLPPDK